VTNRLGNVGSLNNLISGVKNFLPVNKLCPVTRLTEALMDSSAASNQSLQETDDYLFLDPRAPRNPNAGMPGQPAARPRRMAFAEGTVFVVGGAGYVEYGNLEEWAKRTGKNVTYGGTEILDPGGFLEILGELGNAGKAL
jgi:sec1 family domain-containing protein 1